MTAIQWLQLLSGGSRRRALAGRTMGPTTSPMPSTEPTAPPHPRTPACEPTAPRPGRPTDPRHRRCRAPSPPDHTARPARSPISSPGRRWCSSSTRRLHPGCTIEACAFRDAFGTLQTPAPVAGISARPSDTHSRFAATDSPSRSLRYRQRRPTPIRHRPDARTSPRPRPFVIDSQRTIRHRFTSSSCPADTSERLKWSGHSDFPPPFRTATHPAAAGHAAPLVLLSRPTPFSGPGPIPSGSGPASVAITASVSATTSTAASAETTGAVPNHTPCTASINSAPPTATAPAHCHTVSRSPNRTYDADVTTNG